MLLVCRTAALPAMPGDVQQSAHKTRAASTASSRERSNTGQSNVPAPLAQSDKRNPLPARAAAAVVGNAEKREEMDGVTRRTKNKPAFAADTQSQPAA